MGVDQTKTRSAAAAAGRSGILPPPDRVRRLNARGPDLSGIAKGQAADRMAAMPRMR